MSDEMDILNLSHDDNKCNIDLTKYKLIKRAPQRNYGHPNEIYVSRGSKNIVILKKCKKMLDRDSKTIIKLHGLGMAISKAIDIAVELSRWYLDLLEINTTTSTVPVVDDYEPITKNEDLKPFSHVRYVSAIHIEIKLKSSMLD